MEIQDMSNSELKIHMINLENKYESLKSKLRVILTEMEELDKKYVKAKELFGKRTKWA